MNRNKVLIAAFALLCAVLLCAHLRLPHGTQSWRMNASAAQARGSERMPVSMPAGDVNINRGTAQELEKLSGAGPALAQAIITERETNGDFHYPEDLLNVKGIGEKTLEKMRKQLQLP